MDGRGKRATTGKKRDVREAILKAAVEIVEEKGAGAMTLDAVAVQAGISKGGLMHHFKSKEALLTELIAEVTRGFEAERKASVEKLSRRGAASPDEEIEMMSTYIKRAFDGLGRGNRGAMALFAAAIHQPSLLQPVRDYFAERVLDTLEHSRSPRAVLAIQLLADGLWLFDALGIPPFTGKIREQIGTMMGQWLVAAIRSELPDYDPVKHNPFTKVSVEAPPHQEHTPTVAPAAAAAAAAAATPTRPRRAARKQSARQ